MLYVTHDQAEAMMLGDRVGVMRAGRLQQVDKPLQVYRHPANLFVAGFIGSPPMNFLTGRLVADAGALHFEHVSESVAPDYEGTRLRLQDEASGKLQSYAGKTVVLGIRPEHIDLATAPPSMSYEQAVTAVVEGTETTGPDSFLRVSCGGRPLVARVSEGGCHSLGEKVVLGFDMGRVRFFDPATEQAVPGL